MLFRSEIAISKVQIDQTSHIWTIIHGLRETIKNFYLRRWVRLAIVRAILYRRLVFNIEKLRGNIESLYFRSWIRLIIRLVIIKAILYRHLVLTIEKTMNRSLALIISLR